ncbi:MAG: tetratricopeptide repeat protein [Terracidiphilus sp.]|jgi:tetratricopeptide (TPR) repeat protein
MSGRGRFWVLAVILSGMALAMSGCNQLAARDQLNKGVEAFKNGHYDEAVEHFQKATELDPNLPMAKMYLGKALEQNVVPGLTTPDNLKTANEAMDIFKQVLAQNPNDVNSMKEIAGIYFSIKDLDDAEIWQKKVLSFDPKDPEAAYTVGVIDWTRAHENKLKALQAAGLNDDGKGNVKAPKKVMEPLAQENAPLVDEGLKYLTMAVDNRPNYDDAMQYLNLIYRNKADVDYGNAAAVADDLAKAEDWTHKAMDMRKANEEKKNAGPGGITMDNSGQMH